MPDTTHDTRASAFALIAGTFGGILAMALHPHAIPGLTLPMARHLALGSGIAHAIAILGTIALFLGALGFTLALAAQTRSRLPYIALTVFAFASIAIFIATTVSGFILPRLILHMLHDDPAYTPTWHIVLDAVFQFNQSFAQIYAIATSAAIVLWSLTTLRKPSGPAPTLSRPLALYGVIAPPLLILLILVGHIRLDVHGMLAIVLVHAIWFIAAGIQLLRKR